MLINQAATSISTPNDSRTSSDVTVLNVPMVEDALSRFGSSAKKLAEKDTISVEMLSELEISRSIFVALGESMKKEEGIFRGLTYRNSAIMCMARELQLKNDGQSTGSTATATSEELRAARMNILPITIEKAIEVALTDSRGFFDKIFGLKILLEKIERIVKKAPFDAVYCGRTVPQLKLVAADVRRSLIEAGWGSATPARPIKPRDPGSPKGSTKGAAPDLSAKIANFASAAKMLGRAVLEIRDDAPLKSGQLSTALVAQLEFLRERGASFRLNPPPVQPPAVSTAWSIVWSSIMTLSEQIADTGLSPSQIAAVTAHVNSTCEALRAYDGEMIRELSNPDAAPPIGTETAPSTELAQAS